MASPSFVAAVATAVCLVGCGAHDDASLMPPGEPPILLYVGATTDEALARLLDQPPRDDAAHRVLVDTPAAGAPLAPDRPETIAFSPPGTAALTPHRRTPGRPSVIAELVALFGPIRRAHAHGTPFNGTGYLLQVDDAAKRVRLRVFTDQTSYTPAPALWAELAAASPQPLTLTITWAAFEANAIPDGGGPFAGATVALGHR